MISEQLRKWIRSIPQSILDELLAITQDYEYEMNEDGTTNWRKIDAFSQEISYARREGNNPELDLQKGLVFNIELQKWFLDVEVLRDG